jgi:hypothetical protein
MKIVESRTAGSDLYLVGEFTTFDVVNRNKRIYKKENYKLVLEQIADKCASGALMGELGHPDGRSLTDLTQVSHVVTKLEIDDTNNCVRGELKLLDTPNGRIARTLVESGVPLFVSSRASGYITKGGVVTLTNLVTYDLVDEPGFANARLTVRDITESLCSECEDSENVAIFDAENGCAPEAPEAPTVPDAPAASSNQDILNAINALSTQVQSLANRVTAIESARVSAPTVPADADTKAIPAAITTIVDSKISEAIEDVYRTIYDMDERRIHESEVKSLQESIANRENANIPALIKYVNYIAEECNKREKYLNSVVESHNAEMGKIASYLDYVAENINEGAAGTSDSKRLDIIESYLDYVAENINEGAAGTSDSKRLDIIESYLEHIGLEINKSEKAINEKFGKFVEYADYIAKTINENNQEVEMLQQYINEEVCGALEDVINENKMYRKEVIASDKKFRSIDKSINALDTRLGLFNESVNDRMNSMSIINDETEMNDVKKLLENIQSRESQVKATASAAAATQKENLFLEREEKRLLSFMHPSVKHIWESFDNSTKLKIANDMSISKCLATQTQSLMLTRMINNYNVK